MNRVGLYTALVIKGIGWSRNKNKSRYTKLTKRSSKDYSCYLTKIALFKKKTLKSIRKDSFDYSCRVCRHNFKWNVDELL